MLKFVKKSSHFFRFRFACIKIESIDVEFLNDIIEYNLSGTKNYVVQNKSGIVGLNGSRLYVFDLFNSLTRYIVWKQFIIFIIKKTEKHLKKIKFFQL